MIATRTIKAIKSSDFYTEWKAEDLEDYELAQMCFIKKYKDGNYYRGQTVIIVREPSDGEISVVVQFAGSGSSRQIFPTLLTAKAFYNDLKKSITKVNRKEFCRLIHMKDGE